MKVSPNMWKAAALIKEHGGEGYSFPRRLPARTVAYLKKNGFHQSDYGTWYIGPRKAA